jgi:hypothetical protein
MRADVERLREVRDRGGVVVAADVAQAAEAVQVGRRQPARQAGVAVGDRLVVAPQLPERIHPRFVCRDEVRRGG